MPKQSPATRGALRVLRRALGLAERGSSAGRSRQEGRRAVLFLVGGMIAMLVVWIAATIYSIPTSSGTRLRYDQFLTGLREGQIQDVSIESADLRVSGQYNGHAFWLDFGDSEVSPVFQTINAALTQSNIAVSVDQQWLKALVKGPLVSTVLPALIVADALLLSFLLARGTGGFGRSGSKRVRAGETRITFADVAAAREAVVELAEIRDFLGTPDRFLALGARVPRGILLVGPPGCGKTLLARAVAGESEARFFSISGSAFVEMFVGVGAARIRDLFREAQRAAPAIIFIDEIDAIGRGRTSMGGSEQSERESTLNELLVAMDGFDRASGVVVMAATNRPDVLDPALLRRGRFDRMVSIDPPDLHGRLEILKVHTRGKPLADGVDLAALARRTAGFSGADLSSVVNEAALLAARHGGSELTDALLGEAVERIIVGPQRTSRVLSPKEKEIIAYHESGHALVSAVLCAADRTVNKISLVSRGKAGGLTWYDPVEETVVAGRDQLMASLATMLGGRAAEELMLGQPMSTAEADLRTASDLARRMVYELGMAERLGPISLKLTASYMQSEIGGPSQETVALADEEVRALLTSARESAMCVLVENRARLEQLARRLVEVETLEGDELSQCLHPVRLVAGS